MIDLKKYVISNESEVSYAKYATYEQMAQNLEIEELMSVANEATNSDSMDTPNGSNARKAIKKKVNAVKSGDKQAAAAADREYKASLKNIEKDAKSKDINKRKKATRALKIIGATLLGIGTIIGGVAAAKKGKKYLDGKKATKAASNQNSTPANITDNKPEAKIDDQQLRKTIKETVKDMVDEYRDATDTVEWKPMSFDKLNAQQEETKKEWDKLDENESQIMSRIQERHEWANDEINKALKEIEENHKAIAEMDKEINEGLAQIDKDLDDLMKDS